MPPCRRIASNRLWTPQGVVYNPVVILSGEGIVEGVDTCDSPDNLPFTEFYSGLLVLNFPADYHAAFTWLCTQRQPLLELLPQLATGCTTVVLSGLDYTTWRLVEGSRIQKI